MRQLGVHGEFGSARIVVALVLLSEMLEIFVDWERLEYAIVKPCSCHLLHISDTYFVVFTSVPRMVCRSWGAGLK